MDVFRFVHVLGGAAALLGLSVVLPTQKGSRFHRRAGKLFAIGMGAVLASGAAIAIAQLLDGHADAPFLLYVGLLTGAGLVSGIRASKSRSRTTPSRHLAEVGPPMVLLPASVALGALGAARAEPLFLVFAALGTIRGLEDLLFWRTAPAHGRAWLLAHVSGMGTAAIGAVTAFVVVNVSRWAPGIPALVVWIAPGVVGGALITLVQLRLRAHQH